MTIVNSSNAEGLLNSSYTFPDGDVAVGVASAGRAYITLSSGVNSSVVAYEGNGLQLPIDNSAAFQITVTMSGLVIKRVVGTYQRFVLPGDSILSFETSTFPVAVPIYKGASLVNTIYFYLDAVDGAALVKMSTVAPSGTVQYVPGEKCFFEGARQFGGGNQVTLADIRPLVDNAVNEELVPAMLADPDFNNGVQGLVTDLTTQKFVSI